MSFESDPKAQIQAIRHNLDACAQTEGAERMDLHSVVASTVAGRPDASLTLDDISEIKSSIRKKVIMEGWYFLGKDHPTDGRIVYHTHREDKVLKGYVAALRSIDSALSVAEAVKIAGALLADLCSKGRWIAAKVTHPQLALHLHGTPMWFAISEAGVKSIEDQIHLLPARLGLAPVEKFPIQYVLFSMLVKDCHVPRFADSSGYPYWRPGGKTMPISQCSSEMEGFTEVVADKVTTFAIQSVAISYTRTV